MSLFVYLWFVRTSAIKKKRAEAFEKERVEKETKTQQREAAEALVELSVVQLQATDSEFSSTDCSTMTELSSSDITLKEDTAKAGSSLLLQNAQLQEENCQLRFQLNKMKQAMVCSEALQKNDSRVKYFTGLPTYAVLKAVFDLV